MGTRGLTAVMIDGEYKVAQYGQWDHYPSGQGLTVLKFCRTWLTDPVKESQFLSNLATARYATDKDEAECKAFVESIGCKDGWMNEDQAAQYKQRYPYWSRDLGAKILSLIAEPLPNTEIVLQNQITFVGESLWCEYAYVIDLTKGTLEVYKGFNKKPLADGERFQAFRSKESLEYYPVKHLHTFQLNALPSDEVFLEILEPREEEEEEEEAE